MAGKSSRIPTPRRLIETSDELTGTSFFWPPAFRRPPWVVGEREPYGEQIERVLAKAEPSKLNCLEITEVSAKQFLGIPYVHVSAHSRHIQKSPFLQKLAERAEP